MSDPKGNKNIKDTAAASEPHRGSVSHRVVRWTGITAGTVLAVIALIACVATFWFTPARLTELINREASENMAADVKASNARFTFWSTFPRFCLEIDSVKVISRGLDGLSADVMSELPADASYLASTSKVRGGVNMLRLLTGKIYLRDVEVDSIDVNLVAATDSITNYNIFPSGGPIGKVPYFTADNITLRSPKHLKFYSRVTNSLIDIDLHDVNMTRNKKEKNEYQLNINGGVDATVNKIRLLRGFPFSLGGDIRFKFNPFSISTSDYTIALGNMKGKLKMNLDAGEDMKINDLSYHLSDFNVMRLLGYLPPEVLPAVSSLHADVILNASARLTTPYRFSATELPSVEVDFNVADGDVTYSFSDGNSYALRHIGAGGKLVFDGKNSSNSYFDIPEFKIAGDGLDLSLSARVNNVVNSPSATFNIKGIADASKVGKTVKELSSFGFKGNVTTSIEGNVDVPDLNNLSLSNVGVKGDISLSDFGFSYPASGISASGEKLDIDFDGRLASVTGNIIKGAGLSVNVTGDDLTVGNRDMSVKLSGLQIKNSVGTRGVDGINPLTENIPVDLDIATAQVHLLNHKSTTDVKLNGVALRGEVSANGVQNKLVSASMNLDSKSVRGELEGSSLNLAGLHTVLKAKKRSKVYNAASFNVPELWEGDKSSLGMFPHTPEYLRVNLSDSVRRMISGWDGYASIKISDGLLQTPAFPVNNRFKNLYAEGSLDSLVVHKMRLTSQSSALDLSLKVGNLRQFLCSTGIAPIYLSLNAAMDTIQINQLAGAYERGSKLTKGSSGGANGVAGGSDMLSSSDTTALLIPRNLIADIHASAKMTRYMNLRLEDLLADVDIRDGNADVKSLKISSDFGSLGLGFRMNTGNINRMNLAMNGGIHDINVVNFFKNFHALLVMMPQMRNLSGVLSADMKCGMGYYPNMFVDIPSVNADMLIEGRGLTVHQDPFIRKITRMMLIHDAGDIHIKNMNVHATVQDNLVMLYPFNFEFDRYELQMQGVNNFNGDMYYHVGVKKSPVHLPFGINIKGNFSDPQIRFGGEVYKVDQGAKVTRSIMETHGVNMVRIARKYLGEFVHKAAQSDTTPESEYIFK